MDFTANANNFTYVTASGTGVIGATGKPVYLQGVFVGHQSAQAVAFYSGSAAVTMAVCTMAARQFHAFPMAAPGGVTYQTLSNPGDADLRLVFFWIPGSRT